MFNIHSDIIVENLLTLPITSQVATYDFMKKNSDLHNISVDGVVTYDQPM